MKFKKFMALGLVAAMTATLFAGCGSKGNDSADTTQKSDSASADGLVSYSDIVLGETGKDLSATITMFNHRTDMDTDDYGGKNWKSYLEDFNKEYPNIKVEITTDTNYADDALTHLQSGQYETITMIPAVDKADLSTYYMSYGTLDEMSQQINYANTWLYGNDVYGVPSTATTQGIVYNKKVFEDAGVTDVPKTPDEFIDALKKIKDKTDAIPLYTNYAAGWTMGAWDAYIGNNATGDNTYFNQKLLHTKDPFKDYGDGTHPYAVYKILYDAVAGGLTEDDYSTTDWEGSKSMLNNGQIGCMVLGSWAYPQMEAAGENADDIGYMPFPITVDGKQYASAGPDYCYGINVHSDYDNQLASMIYVKWLTEESNFSYDQGGIPICVGDEYPEVLAAFDGVELVVDNPAPEGEEDLFGEINTESEIALNNDNTHVQNIVEHALSGDMTMEEIVDEWNQAWTDAQEEYDVTPAPYVYGSGVVAE